MKLEKIKLSGFKSFVDPTTIPITGNLIGIVGPNGCGKSNIIDAVRWVMGESSAKHLRGGNMADVIFNGSSTRKPVSTASVELIFDNSDGQVGGEFAKYSTLAIKRQVSRDGQSVYMLNGARCRRKDITDLFLGTGLGSRSYAIIEQGTISRMVEAKPEELRVHIEEAAGISKYKERRHETETRMRHTRENLERLDDLREEVEKQLKHLQKQAQKAEQYKQLKKQERQYKVQLLAMRWRSYQRKVQALQDKLQTAAEEHNRLFVLARQIDREVEQKREQLKQQQQQLNTVQGDFYTLVSELSRLQQTIQHNRQTQQETSREIERLHSQCEHTLAELESEEQQLLELRQQQHETETQLSVAEELADQVLQVGQQLQEERLAWQQQWEQFRNDNARLKEQTEVQRSKIEQLQEQRKQLYKRMQKLEQESEILEGNELQDQIESLDQSLQIIEEQRSEVNHQLQMSYQLIREHRQQIKQHHDDLHGLRSELHAVNGKITSLELLQQHAMGKDNKKLSQWLQSFQLAEKQRLAEFLEVEAGWDTAVETVLGTYLEAICIEDVGQFIEHLDTLSDESVTLFEVRREQTETARSELPRLLDKITSQCNLNSLLAGIYCAEDVASAQRLAIHLRDYESIITPQGTWIGPNWLKVIHADDGKAGVLQRERELRVLKGQRLQLQAKIGLQEEQLENTERILKDAEIHRETLQQQDKDLGLEQSRQAAEFSAQSARLEQQQRRLDQVRNEMDEIVRELADSAETLTQATLSKEQAEQALQTLEQKHQELEAINQSLLDRQQQLDQQVDETRQQVHSLQSHRASLRASEQLTEKQLARLQQQYQQSQQRLQELQDKLQKSSTPLDDEVLELQELNLQKQQLEATLKQARTNLEQTETAVTELSEQQIKVQRDLEKQKELLDKVRFEQQENKVRQQTVTEQLDEIEADAEKVLQDLPEQANESVWKDKLDTLSSQLTRLGTINLTAIEEYRTQSERMNFLNEQHVDLVNALTTLDQAINKIDKESKQRFKETFDKINNGLQVKFPKLFGGGQAYLELTEQDLLASGVNIIARPPGKRNASIHLLSGGEKALTAVALVFSIFDLNPAPFCLLDEVDAPLDDANVGRFSKMVEEMSETVQFLYISHNKVTMEIAKQLAGVTMKEPGVSRMVAVDIEEAVNLAES